MFFPRLVSYFFTFTQVYANGMLMRFMDI